MKEFLALSACYMESRAWEELTLRRWAFGRAGSVMGYSVRVRKDFKFIAVVK